MEMAMSSLALENPISHIHIWRQIALRCVLSALRRLETYGERSRSRRQLASLDHRMLMDLGLTRADALAEAEKPFWKV